ncbi:hypothetical protein VNI00_013690 [Paramarasmius palmivorus]|uniref:Uncharacterized protein n=1 Tax=Paramarasmius palmivorus TaxID=297713 RepID=A0AAW0BXP9_9AGAR
MFNVLVLCWINSGPFKESIEQITLPQILQTNVVSDIQFSDWPPIISIDPESMISHSWQGPVNFSTAITSTLPEKPTLTRYYTDTTCHRPTKEPHGADTTYEVGYGLTRGTLVHGDTDGLCEEASRPPLLRLHTV